MGIAAVKLRHIATYAQNRKIVFCFSAVRSGISAINTTRWINVAVICHFAADIDAVAGGIVID